MRPRAGLLLVGLAYAAPASAFELTHTATGADLTWAAARVPYDVRFELGDLEGLHLAHASRAAFDTWAYAAAGALAPEYRGPTAMSAAGDGLSTVSLDAVWDPAFGDPARAVAFAWVQFDPGSGVVREGDVHLNAATFAFADQTPGAFDTQSVVLHELGHVLGLAHSCGDPGRTYPSCFSVPEDVRDRVLEAVMAPTLAPGSARRSLNADDKAGLAVHWHGAATSRPRILAVEARCDGAWWLTLAAPPPEGLQAALRGPDGRWVSLPVLEVEGAEVRIPAPAAEGDVLVVDPAEGVYDAWMTPVPAPVCAGPDASVVPGTGDQEAGCRCDATPPTGRMTGWVLILGGILMATRGRSRSRRGRWAAGVLLAALLLPAQGWAFECSRTQMTIGPSLIWTTRQVPWYAGPGLFALVGDETIGREDALASFAAWEDVDCSDLTFPFQGEADVTAGFDENSDTNTNAVVVVERLWPYQTGAIAVTTSAYDTRNGHVVDADIEFNAQGFDFLRVEPGVDCRGTSNTMDLRNTLTHEVGHVVGLEHPPLSAKYAETTMYASAPACETKKRSLASDDMDGICYIYPSGEPTQQCYPPDGPSFTVVEQDDGFGGCTSAPGELVGGWLILGTGGLLLRRRRRHG